ncbi:hypothetical protein DKX38_010544 [Salix brachista]|uniref:Uncharacterized protein n=1 Tax=Salix brachista TaxID=2182728 RepID=A0A5N5MG11_9ROSI|nr:hypothetical protein DKX38_010544 [Salix brachista]
MAKRGSGQLSTEKSKQLNQASRQRYIGMMGYGPEDKNAGTDDVYESAEAVKLCGGKIVREPGPIPVINTKITACLDPVRMIYNFYVCLSLLWFSNCIFCRKIGIYDYVVEKCFGRKIMGY